MTDAEVGTLASPVPPTTKAAQRQKQRRAAGTPYGVAGSRRRNRRARGGVDAESEMADAKRASGGMFSRLLSYIPIVNQLVGDEEEGFDGEEEEDDDEFFDSDDGMHSDSESSAAVDVKRETETREAEKNDDEEKDEEKVDDEDEDMDEEGTEEDENEDATRDVSGDDQSGTVKMSIMELVVSGTPEKGASTPPSKAPSAQSSASKSPNSGKRSRSRDVELGPVLRTQRRKNSSTQKAFLPVPSQKSKSLRIGGPESPDDDMRRMNRRRQRLASSPMDSPLAVIKHKKTISYEEYERLSHQLRGLVESSPQASLALTQNALARSLEERPNGVVANGSVKSLAYVPGSMTSRDNGRASSADQEKKNSESSLELQLATGGVAFGKRARANENRPIYFSGIALRGQMLTREERVERKPRPSRLLTGAKRDAAARSAYSSAVAEKILSTLNKVQNPLEREATKPTPQTSLSWAKYHLALVEDSASTRRLLEEPHDDVVPPTSTLPRVTFPSSPTRVASIPLKASTVTETPVVKPKASAMLFSPQAVSLTPAPAMHARASTAVAKRLGPVEKKFGAFAFTLPTHAIDAPFKRKAFEMDVDDIQFVFSPSPDQREPPKKISSQKAMKVKGAVETPFSFVPASPKARSDFLSFKSSGKAVASKPASAKTSDGPSGPSSSSSGNPLAKFAQLAPGSWKCSTCSVTNEAKHSKCPCCETAKPAGSAPPSTPTLVVSSTTAPAVSSGANPLARFAQLAPGSWKCPTCSVTNEAKYSKCPCCETVKPGASIKPVEKTSSSSSSGFSFGVPAAGAKPAEVQKSFSFGAAPVVETVGNDVSNPSFTFSAPPSSNGSPAAKSSFSVGDASASSLASASKPSFAFSAPSVSSSEGKSGPSTGFSFGAPTVTAPAAKQPEQTAVGFSFGSATAGSAKPTAAIEVAEVKSTPAAPSFTFGSTTSKPSTVASEPAKSSSLGFSFGASGTEKPKEASGAFGVSAKANPEVSEPAQKKPSFGFGKPDATPEATVPAFSFGAPPKPAADSKVVATSFSAGKDTPSFGFGSSGSVSSAGSAEPKAAFTFGSATPQPPAPAKDAASDGKPSFIFGSSSGSSASTAEASAGFGQDTSSKPAFSFGQSSGESPPKSVPAAPAFGSSATPAFGSAASAPAFGASPAVPASSFGSTPAVSAPSFTFGASSSSAAPTATTPAASSQAPFAFGGSSGMQSSASAAPAASSGFGATTSFGQSSSSAATSTGFGSSAQPATPSAGPAFTFGGSSQSAAPGQSAFGFGGTSAAAPASTSFGPSSAPVSSGFGMSTPASSGFGAPTPASSGFGSAGSTSSGFGASAPTSTAFGAPPTPSSTFGAGAGGFSASPATTFGASNPSSGSAFGAPSAQPSSFGGSSGFGSSTGFGAPSATPSFGAPAPSPAQGFGAPSSGFGAPAASSGFGAPAPSSGFGAPAPSSGFGAPAPSSGFGAPALSTGFGAPAPSSGFGAPAASFGAQPAVSFGAQPAAAFGAPGGFGAPQAGGFALGAAPQAPKGRRILKARSKRTS